MDTKISLRVFQNDKFSNIHYILKGDEPWFLAKDISSILGYSQSSKMVQLLDKRDVDKINPSGLKTIDIASLSDPSSNLDDGSIHKKTSKPLTIINESGLYDAIFNSHKPNAREFRRWVTSEVLPSIRKTGSYNVKESSEELIARALVEAHKILDRKNQIIEEQKVEIEDQSEKITWLECKKNVRVLETKIQEAPRRVLEHYALSDYKEAYRLIYKEFKRFMGYNIRRLWKKKRKSDKETLTQFLLRTKRHKDYLKVIEAIVSVKNKKNIQIEDQMVIWEE